MSAVVHTGSSEARSALGTKVIVFADSAPTMRGAASAVAPARADLRKVRRFISVSLRRVLSLLPPATPAGNRRSDLARCTRPFLHQAPLVLALPPSAARPSSITGQGPVSLLSWSSTSRRYILTPGSAT